MTQKIQRITPPGKYDKWADPQHSRIKIKSGKHFECDIEGKNAIKILNALPIPMFKVALAGAVGSALGYYGGPLIIKGIGKLWQKFVSLSSKVIENEETKSDGDNSNENESVTSPHRKVYSSEDIFSELENQNEDWILDGFIRPGQISFIVGGGSTGKSIIMTDLAIAISKGNKPSLLPEDCKNSMKLDVLAYRIEVFSHELQGKYGKGQILKDSPIGWRKVDELSSFTLEGLIEAFKLDAEKITKPTVILADPVTKIPGYNHKTFMAGAEEAMKIASQRGIQLSIVASAHLDEIDYWKPVTSSDIKGGDILFQQAGAVIAICKARGGKNYKFLKCLKPPKGSPTPFDEKVVIIRSEQSPIDDENWYVHYLFDSIKDENEALPLKPKPEKYKMEEENTIEEEEYENEQKRIFKEMWVDPMFTKKQIAEELKVSTRTLQRWRIELGLPDRNEMKKPKKF